MVINYLYFSLFLFIAHSLVLEVLQALTSNTQIVKESIQKGIDNNNNKLLCLLLINNNYVCLF